MLINRVRITGAMKTFEERKEHALWRMQGLDRSKKGSVDEHAKPLIAAINAHNDYYTTSSCAGRILLLHEAPTQKKHHAAWPIVTHERADPNEFIKTLAAHDAPEGVVWLRMQTVIIHVAARGLLAANALLKQFYPHGWKRSGIFSTENDVMLELLSVESMSAPVMRNGARLVDDAFITEFIALANKKLAIAHTKIRDAAQRVKNL